MRILFGVDIILVNKTLSLSDYPLDYKFNGIDLMKFICSYLVCIIHIKPFYSDSFEYADEINFFLQNCFCRLAVPFFFLVSGFLFFRKLNLKNIDTGYVKFYCFRLLRLFGTWSMLLFIGGNGQLWYLKALVVAVLILTILFKLKIKIKYIFIITFILYFIGLLGDSYSWLIDLFSNKFLSIGFIGYEKIFSTTRNGVFFGAFFVLLGVLFAHVSFKIDVKLTVVGFLVSTIMMFFEVFILKEYFVSKGYNMFLSLIPAVFFLFLLASRANLDNNCIFRKLRIIGMLIFYLHLLIDCIVEYLIKIINSNIGIDFSAYRFLTVIIVVTFVSVVIERLSGRKKFEWLRYLYS